MAKAQQVSPALVLEGGAMRGIFTAGALDVLLEKNLRGFSEAWGTSAGALNALNFRAGQIGRQMRVSLAFRDDSRMMSLTSFARTGNLVGTDFLYGEVQDSLDPYDTEAFVASPMRVWAVATDVVFGTAQYFEICSLPDDMPKVIASASIPLVSETRSIEGGLYLDGGMADSIPVEVALGLEDSRRPRDAGPAPSRALVVLTQPRDYLREEMSDVQFAAYRARYDAYPYFLHALQTRPTRYNAQRERIWQLEQEGRIVVLCPPEPLGLAASESNGEKLLRAYLMGRNAALNALEQIQELLA